MKSLSGEEETNQHAPKEITIQRLPGSELIAILSCFPETHDVYGPCPLLRCMICCSFFSHSK